MRYSQSYTHKRSSLRFRFFIFTLILTGFSFFLFCTVFIISSSYQLKVNTLETTQMSLDQTSLFLQEQMSAFRNSLDTLSLNEDCINILTSDLPGESGEFARHLRYNTLNETISKVLFTSHISDIFIITDNPLSTPQYGKLFPLADVKASPWSAHVADADSSFIWDTTSALPLEIAGDDYVIGTRNLPFTYQPYHTYICGLISRSMFEDLLNISAISDYTSCYVVNSAGNIIFGINQVPDDDMSILQEWMTAETRLSALPHPVEPVSSGFCEYFIGYSPIKNTDLTVIYIYAFSAVRHQNVLTCIRQLGLIFLCILPFVFFLSTYISRHITKPLEVLKKTMMSVSEGNFDIPVLPGTKDEETNSLTRNFNYMLTKISVLLDEQYLNGQRLKDLELQALQAQINPHFLYNTLDLINWSAIRNKDEKTQTIITELSNFYRTGLSKGDAFIPLETEISHIQSYIRIQNMRFNDCITLLLDLPASCKLFRIPKLTLQPIVENAILHGILEAEMDKGVITISCSVKNSLLTLKVTDNGIGMDAVTVSKLQLQPENGTQRSGYGIYNVNERLRLYYGTNYTLHYESQPGQGTSVIITLPLENISTP